MHEPPKKPPLVREAALVPYGSVPGPAESAQQWVTAADFKTHCLRLIDEVMQSRNQVVVTRYGKPVAMLVPYSEAPVFLFGHLSGSVAEHGDLIAPTGEAWDADA
ncbi:MAG TPA: type II toxin-antitoxin system Phd/YefM family antitoxin [Longimicrobium sp.]|nr:type II toxin-antitoxin system Phd/YefM family antitoxin [Longimicrobium sp.]